MYSLFLRSRGRDCINIRPMHGICYKQPRPRKKKTRLNKKRNTLWLNTILLFQEPYGSRIGSTPGELLSSDSSVFIFVLISNSAQTEFTFYPFGVDRIKYHLGTGWVGLQCNRLALPGNYFTLCQNFNTFIEDLFLYF